MYTVGNMARAAINSVVPRGSFERAGAYLGGMAGRGLSNFTGVGDYVFNDIVHTPSMPTRKMSNGWRISNCEFVADFKATGNTDFNAKRYSLNPGDPDSFPWLSRVAQLYQKFKFEQLIFEYRSNTSDYAASGPLGTVIISPVYNVLGDVPNTKQQLEAYAHAVSTKPSNSIMCGVECDPREENIKWYYVRKPSDNATQFTDPGYMLFAVSGLPSTTQVTMGEIWVHYTIKFDEPILTTGNTLTGYASAGVNNSTAGIINGHFAGMRIVNNATLWYNAKDPNISDDVCKFYDFSTATGPPTVPYFVSVDLTPIGSIADGGGSRFWFSEPATYVITYGIRCLTGYTTATVNQPLYEAIVDGGSTNGVVNAFSANRINPSGVSGTTTDARFWAGTFTLVTYKRDVSVVFQRLSTQAVTGPSVPVLQTGGGDNNPPAWVRIQRY